MTKMLACVLFASLLLAAGVALRATATQDRTLQPGQPNAGESVDPEPW
jgi:type II secretory pathway component PulJ